MVCESRDPSTAGDENREAFLLRDCSKTGFFETLVISDLVPGLCLTNQLQMIELPYLLRLGLRLADGLRHLDDVARRRHRDFILSRQHADGGFCGRDDEDSDLYYTSFAVRGLAVLDQLDSEVCDRIGRYVSSHTGDSLSVIDLLSWLYTALIVQASGGIDVLADAPDNFSDRVASRLECTRIADGGYAKTTDGASGSTYHSFLVGLIYELLDRPLPLPNTLIQFVYDRQREDGGFVEIALMKRSGTNPTSAAVALLTMLDAMDGEIRADVLSFLSQVRSDEGGFQANTRIPFADGLSTFTGLLTAQDLDEFSLLKPTRVVRGELEFPTGGFRGAAWDDKADVEYTFYGLGNLGLLWSVPVVD